MSMARQKTDGTRTSTRSPRKRSQAKRVSEPVISFSELDGIRYLHFGSPWVQGAMDIEHPDELVLSYIQDMMAWLLFLEPPAQVLQLGLGAAALTKFTHRHCPDTATTVVEISQQLPWVARQWFGLPPEDDRLMLVQGDAADFVGDPAHREGFGVIQVDLYDEEAAGPVHDGSRFYRSCYRSLAEPGIMVVNLFGRHASFARSEERIRAIFPQVLLLDPQDEGNLVLLASRWGQVVFAPLMMSLSFSVGVCPFKTMRGRRLRRSWMAWTWVSVTSVKLVPLGRYSRIRRLVFSLVGRCQGLWGSAK